MNTGKYALHTAAAAALLVVLHGCQNLPMQTTRAPVCAVPETKQLANAFEQTKASLAAGCEADFDRYMARLLEIAEGDPQADNKRQFSEFLLWATERGLLSKRQARGYYNRYFNTKFVSLLGDYNTCAAVCPTKDRVMLNMRQELQDKELGLLRVSADRDSYYRADRLYQQSELVLEATCQACAATN